ncbi:hypothetical protein K525DRAFT_275099 [Schizophyllum commune Loenen D]|nr:hypothetical protein K525DRAFT_275099 [Schizophyllum commune Loenen D]
MSDFIEIGWECDPSSPKWYASHVHDSRKFTKISRSWNRVNPPYKCKYSDPKPPEARACSLGDIVDGGAVVTDLPISTTPAEMCTSILREAGLDPRNRRFFADPQPPEACARPLGDLMRGGVTPFPSHKSRQMAPTLYHRVQDHAFGGGGLREVREGRLDDPCEEAEGPAQMFARWRWRYPLGGA